MSRLQKIEIDECELAINCPVCGQCVLPSADAEDMVLKPCRHTLFIATDEGFEYRSETFDRLKSIEGVPSEEIDFGEAGIDAFTDSLELRNSMKLAMYTPAPGGLGAYVGFVFE